MIKIGFIIIVLGIILFIIYRTREIILIKRSAIDALLRVNTLIAQGDPESINDALEICTDIFTKIYPDSDPLIFGEAKFKKGICYLKLAQICNRRDNLDKAIDALFKAKWIFNKREFPFEYASITNNIGNAYRTLFEINDIEENIEIAIESYKEVMEIKTEALYPDDYAATLSNLGNAYITLAMTINTEENLNKAISTYETALNIADIEKTPVEYADIKNNLGTAYKMMADLKEPEENIIKAIDAYEDALDVFTPEEFPFKYAVVLNNIGSAYSCLSSEKGIEVYQEALEILSIDHSPIEYAMVQNNLGNAYRTIPCADDDKITQAVCAYEEALKVFTAETHLINHKIALMNMEKAQQKVAGHQSINLALRIHLLKRILDRKTG